MSHRPAGAAERTPEGAVVGRRAQSPCMRVPMHAAGGAASAGRREGVLAPLVGASPLLIAAESAYRGPVGHRGRQWRRPILEVGVAVDSLAADERQHRCDVVDRLAGDREIVVGENGKIGELSVFDLTLLADLGGKPGIGLRPEPQRSIAIELVGGWIELHPTKRAAGYQPGERDPRVVRRDARCVRPSANGDSHLQHPPNGRRAFSFLSTVARDEILALVGHAVLDRDAAAKLGDPLDVAVIDGLAMVEQPMQAIEWTVTVDLL